MQNFSASLARHLEKSCNEIFMECCRHRSRFSVTIKPFPHLYFARLQIASLTARDNLRATAVGETPMNNFAKLTLLAVLTAGLLSTFVSAQDLATSRQGRPPINPPVFKVNRVPPPPLSISATAFISTAACTERLSPPQPSP